MDRLPFCTLIISQSVMKKLVRANNYERLRTLRLNRERICQSRFELNSQRMKIVPSITHCWQGQRLGSWWSYVIKQWLKCSSLKKLFSCWGNARIAPPRRRTRAFPARWMPPPAAAMLKLHLARQTQILKALQGPLYLNFMDINSTENCSERKSLKLRLCFPGNWDVAPWELFPAPLITDKGCKYVQLASSVLCILRVTMAKKFKANTLEEFN